MLPEHLLRLGLGTRVRSVESLLHGASELGEADAGGAQYVQRQEAGGMDGEARREQATGQKEFPAAQKPGPAPSARFSSQSSRRGEAVCSTYFSSPSSQQTFPK